ncbi:MAG: hypothetical protein J0H63_07380 [Rhizobiales bacterium]|nr:hypothetical protein [Hyphomicrobiales bacterium]MBN9009950.1 hypothetical protein [Hyphomicrobiales bacterium]
MESLVLASCLQRLDCRERARRTRYALEQAEFGFRRTVAPPLATLAGVGLFAIALRLVA